MNKSTDMALACIPMPSCCMECKLMRRCGDDDLDYVCMPASVYVEDLTNACGTRPDWCPLIPVKVPRLTATWINYSPLTDTKACSHCGYQVPCEELCSDFCPGCGAEMRKEELS